MRLSSICRRPLVALLLLCAAMTVTVQRVAAVPFSSLSPPPTLQLVRDWCVLMAGGRGVSSVTAADLAPFGGRACDNGATLNAVDLSDNLLTALPDDFLSALPAGAIRLVDLSRNKFTAAGLANLHSALAGSFSYGHVDLSFNNIGPTVPTAVAQWTGGSSLLLMGCGITDVPPNAFEGSSWESIDLSLNDLGSGLHPHSFSGSSFLYQISLSNCNLRSSSLMPGVFDTATADGPFGWSLYMDNMAADLTGINTEILNRRFPYHGLSPKLPLDDRLLSFAALNPPGQPHTNKVTAARYLESWANFFSPFPAGIFYTVLQQAIWIELALGDVASVQPAFLGNASFSSYGNPGLAITLAPQSVVAALVADSPVYCPLHSLMRGLSEVAQQQTAAVQLYGLSIFGFDLPTGPLAAGCALPNCTIEGGCRQLLGTSGTVTLSTEPAMLQRDVMRWLSTSGFGGPDFTVAFEPPPLGLWNPALNRSDWTPVDLFCDLDISKYVLPALPWTADLRMPFPPPGGLLRCPSESNFLAFVDWTAARLFTSDMLAGLTTTRAISVLLDWESLYGGVRPVPVGFFDPLPSSVTLPSAGCGQSCTRIASLCPYFVDSVCQSCPLGSFNRLFTNPSPYNQYAYCSVCPAGSYCNSALSLSPIPCPLGTVQPLVGQSAKSSCQACPTAMTTAAVGQNSTAACVPCPVGWFCDPNPMAVAHSPCPAGTQQPLLSQISAASCTLCAAGKFASSSGTSSCADCSTGRFASAAGASSCAQCTAGQFQNVTGQSACELCSAGTFVTATGASVCTPCATGSFAASDGAGSCQQCSSGHYQDMTGQTVCRQCNAGSANSNTGSVSSTSCQICSPGFAALAGSAVCSECAAGSYSATAGQSTCDLCPTGTYSSLTGRSDPVSCANCPPGRFNPAEGGSALSSCQSCPPGRASNVPGVAACSLCGLGYFNAKNASTECEACPADTFQSLAGATDSAFCTACPPDAPFSPPASASLFQCSNGVVCLEGYYTTAGDQPCATTCPRGSACRGGKASVCAVGSYADREGMGSCTPCGAGSVGAKAGSQSAADCSACPPSTYSAAAVSTACTPCAAGSFSSGSGSASASACVGQSACATAESLVADGAIGAAALFCPTAGLEPIALSALLPGATDHAAAFIARVGRLLRQSNSSDAAAAAPSADAQAAALRAALALYKPERSLPSLRMAAAGRDATLSSFHAAGAADHAPDDHDREAGSSTLSSAATAGLVTTLLLVAFAPLIAYRFVPAKAAVWLDQFSLARKIGVGAFVSNTPSQLGAMVTWSFLWVALLVAILLGMQDNTQRTTELLPPSATSLADTAAASWQMTLRAYTGEDAATMAAWCHSNNTGLLSRQRGFTDSFTLRAEPQGQSCAVLADCPSCGLSALASIAFSFPYSAQLLEWELWVNGAQPRSWGRRYGVLTQLPGVRLLDAETELRFSVMESYYSDRRSASFAPGVATADRRRSGFELNFLSLSSVRPQSPDDFSARSTVTVAFALQKSDVVLATSLSDKQSLLQLGALIASAVVSLFSIFAIGFRLIEAHLFRRCGINTGDVRPVALAATGKPSEIELQPVEPLAELHVTGGRLRFRTLSRALGADRSRASNGSVDPADPTQAVSSPAVGDVSAPVASLSSISVAADPPSLSDFRQLQRVQPEPSPSDAHGQPRPDGDEAADGSMLPDDADVSEDWHL